MTWNFGPRKRRRALILEAVVGAALVAFVSSAPVVGAEANPLVGRWTIQPSPNPSGALASGLAAVSCASQNACVAVGSSAYPSGTQIPNQGVLVEQFSDGTWTIFHTPTMSASNGTLTAVSCPVTTFCAAVGSVQFTAGHRSPDSLGETWNGVSWSDTILPTPPGGSEPSLVAVSCPAQGICTAVGSYIHNKTDTYRPLVERLDGSTWSVIRTPVPPDGGGSTGNSEFTGVDCPTTSQCEVVGNVAYNDTLQSVFAYDMSGSTWIYQSQVNPGDGVPDNSDDAVSCSDSDACTSVGSVDTVGESALAEYWNGTTWVRQRTPAPANRPEDTLSSVSCDGGSSCVAVGESYRIDQKNGHLIDGRVMAQVWNGARWSQSRPLLPSELSVGLDGIACPSPTACIAVGGASTASSESTLVEAYTS